MALSIQCPQCNTHYKLDQEPGQTQKIRCSKCGHTFNTSLAPTLATSIPRNPKADETDGKTIKMSKAPQKQSLIGQEIGGCLIERLLGQGGMGAVYLAHHNALDIPVALKVLPSHFAKKDTTFVDRFIREARSAAKLKHQNIVGVLNVGQDKGIHYIIMDFVDGTSVERLLQKEGTLPVDRACEIIDQVCDALELARKNNIVHRDIKPDNIMIAADGTIKLADLGLAKSVDEDTSVTMSGVAMGTPHYMAPEQAEDARSADHRADLYSLGCTFYRMLCSSVPYEGTSVYAVLKQHENGPIPDPRHVRKDVSDGLAAIMMKMMAKDPNERYQRALDIREDLTRLRQGLPLDPMLIGKVAPSPSQRRSGRNPSVRKNKSKMKSLWLIAAGFGTTLLLIILFWPEAAIQENAVPVAAPVVKKSPDKKPRSTITPPIEKEPLPAKIVAPIPSLAVPEAPVIPSQPVARQVAPRSVPPVAPEPVTEDPELAKYDTELDRIWNQDVGTFDCYRADRKLKELPNYRVYWAIDLEENEEVTLVIGDSDYLDTPEGEQFFEAAELLENIDHPALPQVYDAVETENYFAIVTRILPFKTTTLATYLQNTEKEQRISRFCDLVKQGLEAMSYYNQHQLVHRSITPNRIQVDEQGRLFLWDFKYVIHRNNPQPLPEEVLESLFTAPEVKGGKPCTIQSDLYSLGMTFKELLPDVGTQNNRNPTAIGLERFLDRLTDPNPDNRLSGPNQALEMIRYVEKVKQRFGPEGPLQPRFPRR